MKKIFLPFCSILFYVAVSLSASGQQSVSTPKKENPALIQQLSFIADLVKKPASRTIDGVAANLHFSYQSMGCEKTEQFESYCQYQVLEQERTLGRVLIIAIGDEKVPGKSGGRVVWSSGGKDNCISKGTASSFFGTPIPRQANIPDPIPEQTTLPYTVSEEFVYRSIPNATSKANAVISYKGNCIDQLFLTF